MARKRTIKYMNLIDKKIEEGKRKFDFAKASVGKRISLSSWLEEALKESFREGEREPHNTEEEYCCACDYDIAVFNRKIKESYQAGKNEIWVLMMKCLPKDAENLSSLTDDQAKRLIDKFLKSNPWD